MSAPQGPLDLLFVRASVDAWRMGRESGAADEDNLNLADYAAAILPRLCDELEAARAREDGAAKLLANASREAGELRQRILDIDAHATPFGDIPDEPGWVGSYLVTAGAVHRALGKVGHTAPACGAEAAVERIRALCDHRAAGDAAFLVVAEVRRALGGDE